MMRSRLGLVAVLLITITVGIGAGPATPSYHAIDRLMTDLEAQWNSLPADQNPHGAAWSEFFNRVRTELKNYATAGDADARVKALNQLYGQARQLDSSRWQAAHQLRDELDHWLRPRVALAWAEFRLVEALASSQPELRQRWETFLNNTLRPSIRDVESAGTIAAQWAALDKLQGTIENLEHAQQYQAWSQSRELGRVLDSLYSAPNVEVAIDANGVSGLILPKGIVEVGWVFFRNQWSYVTPGRVTGIGFIPTNDGIQIAVSQALTSTTPIRGFNDQIAADPQGQRATKMYHFDATSRNDAVLTMVALFRIAQGLYLSPNYQHGVSAAISSTPVPGGGMTRLIATLIGQGQRRITDKVYEGAIGQIRDNVVDAARELSGIRTSESAANLNGQIRPYVLDDHTIGNDRYRITDLSLQTLSTHAIASGTLGIGTQPVRGAGAARPRQFLTPASGVTADVHLPSALTSLAGGAYQNEDVQSTSSIMLEAPAEPGGKPGITRNVDFGTYLQAVRDARQSGKDPQAVRVERPEKPPLFSADSGGSLVVLISNLRLEVPAPAIATRGGGLTGPPAQVYRIQATSAEVRLLIEQEQPTPDQPSRFVARIVGIDGGPGLQVLAINEDEASAKPLNAIQSRLVIAGLSSRASSQSIPLPLDALPLSSFVVNSISKLDPTGWIRVVLVPSGR